MNMNATAGAELKIFSGTSNPVLAQRICEYLGVPLGQAQVTRFSDGEIFVEIGENVRGRDVFVVQSTSSPGNDHLVELLIMSDALRRASAGRITAVLPYYGYARQDRKVAPRTPISSKLVADLVTTAGANRVLTMDLHAGQIQGFFNVPVDHLFAAPVLLRHIWDTYGAGPEGTKNLVVVSPDAGGVERARAFAKRLNCSLAIIDKRRTGPNQAQVMNIVGDVAERDAVIIDDIVDTAGTLTQGAEAVAKQGARRVFACCTHPVLSGKAVERIEASVLEELVVSDTIPLKDHARPSPKIRVLSIAELLGEAIRRIHEESSVSSLFV